MKRVAAVLRWAADQLDDKPQERSEPMTVPPIRSVFEDGDAMSAARREDAMRLMDDETHGYVILFIRDRGTHTKVEPSFALLDEMWPAVRATLARVEAAGRAVYTS